MKYDLAPQYIEGVMKMIVGSRFDPVEKARIRAEQFPKDCEKAFDMGVRFSKQIITDDGKTNY